MPGISRAPWWVAALCLGCSLARARDDAGAVDGGVDEASLVDAEPMICVWSLHVGDGWCGDLAGREACAAWARSTTSGSTLVAYADCDPSGLCIAGACDAEGNCGCGSGPACGAGMIGASRIGTSSLACVSCAVGDR